MPTTGVHAFPNNGGILFDSKFRLYRIAVRDGEGVWYQAKPMLRGGPAWLTDGSSRAPQTWHLLPSELNPPLLVSICEKVRRKYYVQHLRKGNWVRPDSDFDALVLT
jgi:hypothetical protein